MSYTSIAAETKTLGKKSASLSTGALAEIQIVNARLADTHGVAHAYTAKRVVPAVHLANGHLVGAGVDVSGSANPAPLTPLDMKHMSVRT